MTFFLPLVEERDHGVDVRVLATVLVDVETHLREALQDLLLAPGVARRIEGVDERVEAPARGDSRIELPNRARGRVTGIREQGLALGRQLGVQSLEAPLRHV